MKTANILVIGILSIVLSCSSQPTPSTPPQFSDSLVLPSDLVTDLHNGYYIAQDGANCFGIKSEAQDTMLAFCYDAIEPLWTKDNDAFAFAAKYQGRWGVITLSGSEVLPFRYDHVWIPEDHEVIVVGNKGKFGMYDYQGHELLPELYGAIYPCFDYEDGQELDKRFLLVEDYDGRGGIADYEGNIIVPVVCTKIACAEGYWFTTQYDDNRYAAYLLDGRPVSTDEVDGRRYLDDE